MDCASCGRKCSKRWNGRWTCPRPHSRRAGGRCARSATSRPPRCCSSSTRSCASMPRRRRVRLMFAMAPASARSSCCSAVSRHGRCEQRDSRVAYTVLVALVAAERGLELRSRRATPAGVGRAASRRGAATTRGWCRRTPSSGCLPAEVWLLGRSWNPLVGVPALLLVAATMSLRYWVVRALAGGGRHGWCTSGDPLVKDGPFRYLRHRTTLQCGGDRGPSAGARRVLTAATFSAANAVVLGRRIAIENRCSTGCRRAPCEFEAMKDDEVLRAIEDVARKHLGWEGR